jgi:hypothetical protein
VPASVLLAVSYQETLWDSHQGQPSSTGNYNVMGLTQVEASEIVPATKAQKEADLDAFGDGQKHPAYSAKLLADVDTVNTAVPALHTLDAAAALVKQPASALRSSMQQSVRGGAALLASYERTLHGSLPSDPGAWFAAIAEYDQASDTGTATQFADRVYATIQSGASRTTADGQLVTLTASPSVVPQVPQSRTLAAALTPTPATSTPAPPAASPSADATSPSASATSSAPASSAASAAKPRDLAVAAATPATSTACPQVPSALAGSCTFVAANANNFDQANRPVDGDAIRYIVIHDTEASAASTINSFEDPSAGVAAHYVIAANGAVTQMVPTQDTGIHADNKTVNMHSIGIEHEGYALENGSWFSEQEYESSAELVQYLAKTYSIPLDRDHILGHDDVPYAFDSAATVTTQHVDPGTYWDWGYYLGLLGAPISGDGQAIVGGTVTIAPPYNDSYEPTVTGCVSYTATCSARPANFVYLRTGPSTSDPLIGDSVLSSNQMGSASTNGGDVSDKADYGQTFVVAALSGSWTAIWYGGKEAWFYNPGGAYAFANSNPGQTLVTPVGSAPVQVYGRAYPETSAYPASQSALAATAVQQVNYDLLPYTIPAGQAYTTDGEVISGDYYNYNGSYNASDSTCANTADQCEIIDKSTAGQYYQIRYDHRIGYVLASQVQTITAAAPPVGTYNPISPTRILDTRYGTGTAKAPVKAGKSISVQVEGQHGLPATGVTAVVLNVTATDATATSYVSVYPDGQSVPGVSNLNFTKNETIPNLVVVPVGADGKVDLYNSAGSVALFADMSGYYTSNGSGSKLVPVGPTRILDTRYGTGAPKAQVGAGQRISLQVEGQPGVPATGVTAVVLNVTATRGTATSFVSVFPDGQTGPVSASNLNFTKGETIPNLVIVPVAADGKVDLYNSAGSVDLFADMSGYFTANGSGSGYHTVGPVRVMDTRNGTGVRKGVVGPGGKLVLQLGAGNGVPLKATAAVLNVTVTDATATSLLTVYPDGQSLPGVSNLNFSKGETIPNLVVVPVIDGKVDFTNALGNVQVFADLMGYYTQ